MKLLHRRCLPLSLPVLLSLILLQVAASAAPLRTEIVGRAKFVVTDDRGKASIVPDLAASGQILCKINPSATAAQLQAMLNATGCRVLHEFKVPGLLLLGLPQGMSVTQAASTLERQTIVRNAEPDRLCYTTRVPNDPYYAAQYHWPRVQAPTAWDHQTGSSNVVVAVVDSGVDMTHEDLVGQLWKNTDEVAGNGIDDDANGFVDDTDGWDFASNNNDPSPGAYPNAHGTHVAGLIGAASDNALGVTGHCWNVRLMCLQVFNGASGLMSACMSACEYAINNGADVINLSLGGGFVESWTEIMYEANAANVCVIAASGNDSNSYSHPGYYYFTDDVDTWKSPVCNDGLGVLENYVLGVGATDADDKVADFTNLDQSSQSFVDVMSPGVEIYSTYLYDTTHGYTERYGYMSGTSMACPIVAGLAALMVSDNPSASVMQIYQMLKSACQNIDSMNSAFVGTMGAGRINSANSLSDQPPAAPRAVTAVDTPNDSGGSITVTWSPSTDDGRGFNDVEGYEVWRSEAEDGPFDKLATLEAGSRGYVDQTTTDYVDYFYKVVCFDAANRTESRVTPAAQSRDDVAPEAVAATAADTQGDTGGSITVAWSDYSPPADFGEYRVFRAESSFSDVTGMEPLATIRDRTKKSYVDTTTEDDKDYYYAVTCADNCQTPNALVSVTCAGPVRSNPNYAFNFAQGLSLIGVGLNLQDGNLSSVFGDTSGLTIARWDPSGGGYSYYSPDTEDALLAMAPGRGFWLRSPHPVSLVLSGSAATRVVSIPFTTGWNMLANPYIDAIDITGAQVRVGGTLYSLSESNAAGYTADYFWGYNTGSNSYRLIGEDLPFADTGIAKGEGFFFLAARAGQLLLQMPASTASASVKSVPAPRGEWSLQIVASAPGSADKANYLGVSSRAADLNGITSPPSPTNGPDFSFTGRWDGSATAFVKSLGQGRKWHAQVTCPGGGAQIKLSWPDLSNVPNECRPILTDLSNGKTVYMRTCAGYAFRAGQGEKTRRFSIELAPKAGDTLVISSLQAEPIRGGLRLAYTLSAPATVEAEVLNLAGRSVRRLAGGSAAQSGEILWNCAAEGGQPVPNGRYLVRLTARAENGQQVTSLRTVELAR